jgi:pimeloyl-ACP methyl ester carboxylesterase
MTQASGQPRYARNGAVDIAYEVLGGCGGEPLLLIMGMAVSRYWWPAGFVRALAEHGFHVVAYDQRDSGQSTRFTGARGRSPITAVVRQRTEAYRSEDMADDAVTVLDAVGWDAAHLFGVSMGGLVAQRVALRHPARVRTLTTMAAQPSDAGVFALLRYIRLGTLARLTRLRVPAGSDEDVEIGLALARLLASPGYPFDAAAARERIARDVRSGVRDIPAQARQAGASWHGGRLADLRTPALVLHGSADPLLRPAAGRDTAAAIPGARLVILPGVGHDLPAEVWPEIAAELRALADRSPATRLPGRPPTGQAERGPVVGSIGS